MGTNNADEAMPGAAEQARLSIDGEGRYVIRFAEVGPDTAAAEPEAVGEHVALDGSEPAQKVAIPLEAFVAASAKMARRVHYDDPYWDTWSMTTSVQEIFQAVCQYAGIELETPSSPCSDDDWTRAVNAVAKSPKLDQYEAAEIARNSGV